MSSPFLFGEPALYRTRAGLTARGEPAAGQRLEARPGRLGEPQLTERVEAIVLIEVRHAAPLVSPAYDGQPAAAVRSPSAS
jgi:hypothetical protein